MRATDMASGDHQAASSTTVVRAVGLGLLLAAVGGATLLALGSGGSPLLSVLPVLLAGLGYAVVRMPLRWPVTALLAMLLALDVSGDGDGVWHTPFAVLGDLLHKNIDRSIPIPGLTMTGTEVIFVLLVALYAYRRLTGSSLDVRGQIPTAGLARDLIVIFLAAAVFVTLRGVTSGASVPIWLVRRQVHVVMFFLLFQIALRGPRDHVLLGRVILIAAHVKAILAIWVQHMGRLRTGGELAQGTNHGDSILFALAIAIVVARLFERFQFRRLRESAFLLLLPFWGMYANNRRLAWVMLGMGLATIFLLSPMRRLKRSVLQAILVLIPVVAVYTAVGWNRQSVIFAPVRTLRSLSDSTRDRSTLWREVEDWNIAMSMRESPLLGIGLGKEYTEHMPNDDISVVYPEFRMWPHNSVLGMLLFGGLFAFTGMWLLFAGTIFLAVRSLDRARAPDERTAALCVVVAVLLCLIQAYGDLGAAFAQYRIVAGLALAVAGKLAVATGAWPASGRRTPRLVEAPLSAEEVRR